MTTMTEVIDVAIDPLTAFTIFTDEFDQWWGRGPIDAYDTWRLVERRIEGGVGGRLVEDYGDEERVTGTITIWEPGAAGVDDPQRRDDRSDVRGARLRYPGPCHRHRSRRCRRHRPAVDAPHGAAVVPRYLNRRSPSGSRPDYGRLHLALRSATPAATARWLADVFQLEATADIPDQEGDPDYTWIEFRVGTSFIVLWGGGGAIGTDSPFVYVDDLDAHLKHVEAAGATIISPITEHGFRSYTAADCEGRQWVFAQSGPHIGH